MTAIEQQAADFATRVHSGDATEADWLALEAWLAENPGHAAAFDRAEALWLEIDALAPEIATALAPAPTVIEFRPRPRAAPRRFIGWAAAAALVLAIGGGIGWWMQPAPFQTYRTLAGETRTVALADGSRLTINGGSSLTVQLSRGERRVRMGEAEASFDVTHDPRRPFLIEVGGDEVRVVGTEFNIDRKADQTRLTVRRGLVQVRNLESGEPVQVAPGQEYVHKTGAAPKIAAVKADDGFAWQDGRLVYDHRPLSEVAGDLSRRFAHPVRAEGAAADLPFTGVLVLDDEDAVINRLEALLPVKADRAAAATTLRSAP